MVFVALFTRAWIEINKLASKKVSLTVALFTRAWIEIFTVPSWGKIEVVALFTRAWIEIFVPRASKASTPRSPSSRGRGLKSIACCVAMFWQSRPLHEGVD